MTVLHGSTWNHPRGLNGLRSTARLFEDAGGTAVEWTARSLQAFADESVDDLAHRFDLLVLDHPSIGFACARGSLVALDDHLGPEGVDEQRRASVGRSFESYRWGGRTWALATDVAAQVAAYRPNLLDAETPLPRTWDEVIDLADELGARGVGVAMAGIPVDLACAFAAGCAEAGGRPFEDPERVAARDVARGLLETLRRVLDRCHPACLELDPPALFELMSTTDEVAYCALAFGYVNYAREGFRHSRLRFAGGPPGTLGGAGLAVSSYCSDVESAVRYASLVAQADVQRGIYVDAGGQPGNRNAWLNEAVNETAGGFFADTLEATDRAYLRPRYDGFLAVQDSCGRRLHRWFLEGGAIDALLDDLDAVHRAHPAPLADEARA